MGGIYWIASYPKSGNTWFRTFLHNLQSNTDAPVEINDLATGSIASSRSWIDRVVGFEVSDLTHEEIDRLRPDVYRWALQADEIGYHKIHDAYQIGADGVPLTSIEGTLGALYIVRNPLDVAPSFANHNRSSIDTAIELMGDSQGALSGSRRRLHRQLRQVLRSWSGHVESWVDAPGLNCHVLRYEDMHATPQQSFGAAAKFLGLPHDVERVQRAVAFSAFEELSRQEAEKGFRERPPRTERFFLQGKSGGWREKLTSEQVKRIVTDHGPMMQRFGYLDADGHAI
jgi:hypothetical protein